MHSPLSLTRILTVCQERPSPRFSTGECITNDVASDKKERMKTTITELTIPLFPPVLFADRQVSKGRHL
jgi:hypothetical protein